jgi:hypothetical protein
MLKMRRRGRPTQYCYCIAGMDWRKLMSPALPRFKEEGRPRGYLPSHVLLGRERNVRSELPPFRIICLSVKLNKF